jgi:hypothetical protein
MQDRDEALMIEESDGDPNIDGIDHASQLAGEANVTL